MSTSTELLTNKFLEIINQLQTTVTAHGQEAVNLALAAIQQDGFSSLFDGSLFAIIAIICAIISRYFYKNWVTRSVEEKKKQYCDREDVSHLFAFMSIPAFIGALAFIVVLLTFGCYWNYVEIFNPKVYLAHEIIQHVLPSHNS